jgi:hypothetical protein
MGGHPRQHRYADSARFVLNFPTMIPFSISLDAANPTRIRRHTICRQRLGFALRRDSVRFLGTVYPICAPSWSSRRSSPQKVHHDDDHALLRSLMCDRIVATTGFTVAPRTGTSRGMALRAGSFPAGLPLWRAMRSGDPKCDGPRRLVVFAPFQPLVGTGPHSPSAAITMVARSRL